MGLHEHVLSILPSIQGWCTPPKATAMMNLILEHKPTVCVEIGVFGGSSLVPQAYALKELGAGIVYGIDPWRKDDSLECMTNEANKNWWSKINYEDVYNHAKKNLEVHGLTNHAVLIRSKSEDCVNNFAEESIDLLHVDGNHSEELSYKDAISYLPKVKKGGYILFDDIFWSEDGKNVTTKKALTFLLEHCEKINVINNECMLLRKKL